MTFKSVIQFEKEVSEKLQNETWEEPTPLAESLSPVLRVKKSMLPSKIADFCESNAKAAGVPLDYLAIPALICASSLCGSKVVVLPKSYSDDWQVICNLSGGIIAPPGSIKSESIDKPQRPIIELQKLENEKFENLEIEAKNARDFLDSKGRLLEKSLNQKSSDEDIAKVHREIAEMEAQIKEPVLKRLRVHNTTMEKLGMILADNPNGVLMVFDELNALFTSFEKQGHETDREFYLTALDGNRDYTFDRISRGTLYLPRVTVAVLGATVPSKVKAYVGDALKHTKRDDGCIQRFGMLVYPDPLWIDEEELDEYQQITGLQAYFDAFNCLHNISATWENPKRLRFSPEAQPLILEWRKVLRTKFSNPETHEAIQSAYSKYRKTIPALAGVIQLLEDADSTQISLESTQKALAWFEYLESHMLRIYGMSMDLSVENGRRLIEMIKKGDLGKESFRLKDLTLKRKVGMQNKEETMPILELLVEHGYLRKQTQKWSSASNVGEREGVFWLINPKIF